MRRKDREITDFTKMMDILAACDCCRIGLADAGEPYIVPLNFGYEEADGKLVLYFHSAGEGRKIDLIPKQKTAAFEMDTRKSLVKGAHACDYSYLYQCIMGKGKLEIIEDYDLKIHGLQRIMLHYSGSSDWQFRKGMLESVKVLRLTAEEWSCKEHQS